MDPVTPSSLKYFPVVDGKLIKVDTYDAHLSGKVKPNCPISWNYAEHDRWPFVEGTFNGIRAWLDIFNPQWARVRKMNKDRNGRIKYLLYPEVGFR